MSRLTVITQVYPPDPAAVGQHLADVAESMAGRGWKVTVFTSARGYDDPSIRYPLQEIRQGVTVRRLRWSSFGKGSILIRLIAQSLFMAQACMNGLFGTRPDVILASTSPPFGGFLAAVLARIRRVKMVWWVMDLNPDQMIAAGKIGPHSICARIFDAMNFYTLSQATQTIALDEFMAERLRRKKDVGERMNVIPPWSPGEQCLAATEKGVAEFRARHRLGNKVVVMYSGNHAMQHPLDTLLATAQELEADRTFVFVFVGGGAGKAAVEKRLHEGATNIVSLPYQPLERLGESLHAADLHVVSMGADMVGIVHPCKIYGLLALGKPVLMLGPADSAAGKILRASGTGWIVPHGDTTAAVAAIHEAAMLTSEQRKGIAERLKRQDRFYARPFLLGKVSDLVASAGSTP